MNEFKNVSINNHPMANIILTFYEWGYKNPKNLIKCNGSYSLWRKCKFIKDEDGYISKYGGDTQTLKKKMYRLGINIYRWHKINKGVLLY